jgi:Protein of unknown function (DUF2914)/Tetratricopeptide repeat
MPELREARDLLEMAERAAIEGDFPAADELLRDAARIQEAEFGPVHPDLANTLNNLAIVAEKAGRTSDAETFYRRAAAIASASLPADHPIVAESRQNLEDFCRERGLPIAAAPVLTPMTPRASQPLPLARRRSSRPFAWVAIGAIILMAVVVAVVRRPWSVSETSTVAPTAAQANEPVVTPPVTPAPIEQAQPSRVAPQSSSAAASSDVTLAAVQLCQTFSTSGGRWLCVSAGDQVAAGPIVLYTRIRSSRDATVEHRWYRDDILRQAVKLTIRANASEGYRTYSRQTLDGVGNWRVEVRSADGYLLHEGRFTVQ